MSAVEEQKSLFALSPPEVTLASVAPERGELANALPNVIRFGTMSWTYKGWRGLVYGARVSEEAIVRHGLTAYAKHPLLRAVEIDRTYYEPLPAEVFASFAAQVPEDFRFVVKAHEATTTLRFPEHARYGKLRGTFSARYLDAAYVEDQVLAPLEAGLGDRLGALLFQFSPRGTERASAFADELHAFLRRLPRRVCYAVELRNPELLTPEYAAMLADVGAIHCHNAWTSMPDVLDQARAVPPSARSPLLVRWLARRGERFEDAKARYAPFNRIVAEDAGERERIARLVARAELHGVPSLVFVSNNAEGCSPESIARLARAVVTHQEALRATASQDARPPAPVAGAANITAREVAGGS